MFRCSNVDDDEMILYRHYDVDLKFFFMASWLLKTELISRIVIATYAP